MKKILMMCAVALATWCAFGALPEGGPYKETVGGIEWTFMVQNGSARVAGGPYEPAISFETVGDIFVPSILGGHTVVGVGEFSFWGCKQLTSVTMPSSVTSIGMSAFRECSGLTRVVVPSGVKDIGQYAFMNCSGLNDVMIPEGVESIADGAFYGCLALASVKIPSSVMNMGDKVFVGCNSLEEIIVASGNSNYAVYNKILCDIGGKYAFQCPGALKSVTLPPKVTSISKSLFREGDQLTSISIGQNSSFSIRNRLLCDKAGKTVLACPSGLSSVDIPTGVTAIEGSAFRYCRKLTSVILPVGVKSIGSNAFYECSKLTSVDIPSTVTEINGSAFSWCSSLASVSIPLGVKTIAHDSFCGCESLLSIIVPPGVTSIGGNAFGTCSRLESISIPASVTSIDVSAFQKCTMLGVVHVAKGATSRVRAMLEQCFVWDASVADQVTIIEDYDPEPRPEPKPEGGPYTEKVGSVTWTFMVDDNLEAIVGTGAYVGETAIPTSTKGAVTIPSELGGRTVICIANLAFAGCSGMTSVMIPEGITDIGDTAFYNCDGLASVTLPASVVRIGFGVFANCKGLKTIKVAAQSESFAARDGVLFDLDEAELIQCPRGKNGAYAIPSTVTAIRAWAFYKCDNLTSVTIPESVTDIGTSAFAWCKGLTSMTLPFGLTNVGESAFVYCQGLKSVTIPSSVKAIGKDAFLGCDDLKTVYVDEGDERRVKTLMERSGFDTDQVEFRIIGETPTYEVVAGMKVSIDVGFVGYTAKNLPKGLSFNGKTGLVTGTTKVTGTYEATFSKKGEWDETAIFEVRDEEDPEIDCPGLEEGEFTVGVAGESGGIPIGITAESGVKSVSAKNLPAGMKVTQDKLTKEWYITGGPTKAGYYPVTLTVTTAAGNKADQSYVIEVAALPDMAVGTFNGFVTKQDNAERFDPVIGAIQMTATDAGKISAKVTTADKAYSFTATCWDSGKEGRYSVEMSLKTGETLTLELDTGAGWDEHQLTGSFDHKVLSGPFDVAAQRNAFGKTWSFDAEGDATEGWTLTYAENPKTADLTLTLNADGKTTLAGKLGTLKVSASGYSDVSGMRDGALIADFAPVVTVNKAKTIISIHTNLWFDRSNEHEFIGSAKLMD